MQGILRALDGRFLRPAPGGDLLRTTAILQPSVPVLEAAGLWQRLAPFASPLQVMRIVDAGGPVAEPRLTRDFDAADISDDPFGWNLPNWLLRREMVARLAELPKVDFRPGTGTAAWWLAPMKGALRWGIPQLGARDFQTGWLENQEIPPDRLAQITGRFAELEARNVVATKGGPDISRIT